MKPIPLIPTKDLPNHVLCIGMKTKDQTVIVHKKEK